MLDPNQLRDRAQECRAIAKGVVNAVDAELLEEIAEELDSEARQKEKLAALALTAS
jgi:hypothetical protein